MTPCDTPFSVRTRFAWIDILRGLAVLGMIETHAVNSFLDPSFRTGAWFALLSYTNGLVAPTFLFLAGLLQGVSIRKNWITPKPIWPRLRSLGKILLIGYALQFPWDTLSLPNAENWIRIQAALGKVDVLHCIAVSLAAVILLAKLLKNPRTFELGTLLVTLTVMVSGPFVWENLSHSNSTTPLFGYLSPARGALFPLIPWMAFVTGGALASRWLDRPKMFAVASLIACAVSWILKFFLHEWFQPQSYAVRYDFYFSRLSLVLVGCCICSILVARSSVPGVAAKAISWCGRASLSLYVWHLVLLHSGLGLIRPLRDIFSKTQTPWTVVGLFLLTLVASLGLAFCGQAALQIFKSRSR